MIKRCGWMVGVVAVVLSALAPAYAQDVEEVVFETFEAEDERLSLLHPENWVIEASEDGPGVVAANSEAAFDAIADTEAEYAPGDVALTILLFPTDYLPLLEIEVEEAFSAVELAEAFAEALFVTTDEGLVAPELGEAEEVEVEFEEETLVVGSVELTNAVSAGALVAFELQEGILVIALANTAPGEYADFAPIFWRMLASLEYAGNADDLIAQINQ
ncbi:MAG: hypothetical protein HC915_21180 [Anaerolineae bacterium]|nr:hypothetical protein [Anaerolineae bacterium]